MGEIEWVLAETLGLRVVRQRQMESRGPTGDSCRLSWRRRRRSFVRFQREKQIKEVVYERALN
jgi:hypothetical protein